MGGSWNTSERTNGLYSVLSLAPVYSLAQRAIGAERVRQFLVSDVIRPEPGERVLDIGSGTSDILDHLGEGVDYIGLEPSASYVARAKSRYRGRGEFVEGSVESFDGRGVTERTLALAVGVLHHLDDDSADNLLGLASRSLAADGRFISIDCTFVTGQSRLARWIVSQDRGQYVRSPERMEEMVCRHFADVTIIVRHDLLRVPYSHVVVRARGRVER